MELKELLKRILTGLLEVPVQYCSMESYQSRAESFCKKHIFSEQAQPVLEPAVLRTVLEHLHPNRIYYLSDPLGIHISFFLFEDAKFLLGPWVEEEWNETRAESKLASLKLPVAFNISYQLYYCRYRVIERHVIQHVIETTLSALRPDQPLYIQQELNALPNPQQDSCFREEPLDYAAAVQQYQRENYFVKMITQGRTQAALEAYKKLSAAPSANQSLMMRQFVASATIVRTLARKAAESGGVHPAVVDAISQTYAQKMYLVAKPQDAYQLILELIQEFSQAVQKCKTQRYSHSVCQAMDYIQLHLSQNLSLKEIASFAVVSPNYLSQLFKKETGVTLSQYIARQRCDKAAKLLLHTSLPIQEISRYVGYLDNNYFVKVFREFYHTTPSLYRKRNK